MSSIVVCGGSVIGLSVAMMLARDGHEVTVLESDAALPPASPVQAWDGWERSGVRQFLQPHNLFARFRAVVDVELPGLTEELVAAGCRWVDPLAQLPPSLTDTAPRPGDDRLRFVTGRRPVVEYVVAATADREPGVTVRRGCPVAGLVAGPGAGSGVPHVAGVRLTDGATLYADLVVDATGRRTPSTAWLAELGARPAPVEQADCGFAYYTRYFAGPRLPVARGPAMMPLGCISLLTLPGDNGTWSVTVFAPTRDAPLKSLRHAEVFDRVVRACPLQAHWLDGRPITGVLPMAGVLDCHRSLVVDGEPVATGFVAVGDAWACTNPSAGRGLSVGIVHAQALRRVVTAHLGDPVALARRWQQVTEADVEPFYRNQLASDRVRLAEMDAARAGRPPAEDPDRAAFAAATVADADVFRATMEMISCLALPSEVMARPGMPERIARYAGQRPPPMPGPDRSRLLDLLAA